MRFRFDRARKAKESSIAFRWLVCPVAVAVPVNAVAERIALECGGRAEELNRSRPARVTIDPSQNKECRDEKKGRKRNAWVDSEQQRRAMTMEMTLAATITITIRHLLQGSWAC